MYAGFAYIADTELRSHRGIFQSLFDSLTGVMVHLASKSFEGEQGEGWWFAGEVMDWNSGDALVFLPHAKLDVIDLIHQLLRASPEGRILFSTDNQSDDIRQVCGEVSLSDFLQLHDDHVLRYNSLWYIRADQ